MRVALQRSHAWPDSRANYNRICCDLAASSPLMAQLREEHRPATLIEELVLREIARHAAMLEIAEQAEGAVLAKGPWDCRDSSARETQVKMPTWFWRRRSQQTPPSV